MVNWISLSTTTGNSGETQITLTVSPNTEYSSRTTTLNVTTQSKHLTDNIVINQAQKSATGSMTFNPSGLSYSYEGGILYLHFTANTDWNVVSWPTWVGVSGDVSGGTGSYVWGVTALQNTRLEDLNSQFTFYCGGNYFTIPVHQDAYQESSSIYVSPTSISNISSGGSAYTITITSNTGWTVTSKPEWVTLSATAGTGNGTITATIASNSGNTRTGSIGFSTNDNVASASVSLTQNAAYVEPSYISVSPSSISNISSGGSAYTVTVSANTNWTITAKPEWATLSQTAGTGNATITVTIPANSGDTRTGNINFITTDNVASASVSLSQNAADEHDYSQEYLTFEILSNGEIIWKAKTSAFTKTIEYSKNDGTWTSVTSSTSGTPINVVAGDIVYFKGDNAIYSRPTNTNTFSGTTCDFKVKGNIMSLINSTDFANLDTLESAYTFYDLFSDCTGLTDASNLVLPATTLTEGCYDGMFMGCTSLTTAPELPATTLANNCYLLMFDGCTSLTAAPSILPATTLAYGCYSSMFTNCTSLTAAPSILPATTVAPYCYSEMFTGCRSLTTAPALPATTLANDCYILMFDGCTSLTAAPSILPATTLVNGCYSSMFRGCTSLTTAPALPATTLADSCYAYMFTNCSNLNYIKCLATDVSASYCTLKWFEGVQTTAGTFVKNPNMTGWWRGTNGIPPNWTVQDA